MKTELSNYSNITADGFTAETIDKMQKISDQFSINWDVIKLARDIAKDVESRDKIGECDAIFQFVKDNVKFYHDPVVAETLQNPFVTIEHGGDCDDFSILFASLVKALGSECAFATISYPNQKNFAHVFCAVPHRVTNEIRFYDPSMPESYPGWKVPTEHHGRIRIWKSRDDYNDLGNLEGFFDDVVDFFKDLIDKIYEEIKRLEKRIRDELERTIDRIDAELKRLNDRINAERDRVYGKIAKEFARWEQDLGPFGKILVVGAKVGISAGIGALSLGTGAAVLSPIFSGSGIATAVSSSGGVIGTISANSVVPSFLTGQTIAQIEKNNSGGLNPWRMNEEDWAILRQIAVLITSSVLTAVTAGTGVALLAKSVLQIIDAGLTAIDTEKDIKERKEFLSELKKMKTKFLIEARVQKAAIRKLEIDIFILSIYKEAQSQELKELEELKIEQENDIADFVLEEQEKALDSYLESLEKLKEKREKAFSIVDKETEKLEQIEKDKSDDLSSSFINSKIDNDLMYLSNARRSYFPQESEQRHIDWVAAQEEKFNKIIEV